MQQENSAEEPSQKSAKPFAIQVIVHQIILIILYGVFVKVDPSVQSGFNESYYAFYQDINVMMLIGFGFLMVFIKNNSWSALTYTFIINAIVVQQYILWQQFWHKTFKGTWDQQIYIKETNFTGASYCVAAMLIGFGSVLGKIDPNNLITLSNFGVIFYTLNQTLCYQVLGVYDAGGSTVIHTFGAYFGVTMAILLGSKLKSKKQAKVTKISATMAMVGTFFLWMFWPSFNAGVFPLNQFQKSLVISNTILSLTGSCISAIAMSILIRKQGKIEIEDVLNASLAGGVIIGAPCGVLTNPGGALAIGFIGGAISSLCFAKLGPKLKECIYLDDTCGVHNLHGIPGVLGGILSAIVIAAYQSKPMDENIRQFLLFYHTNTGAKELSDQAGIQIAATFISLGFGIVTGLIVGGILRCSLNLKDEQVYEDRLYFAVPDQEENIKPTQGETFDKLKVGQKKNLLPPIERPSQIVLNGNDQED